jgi:hypothetical protein
MHRNHELTALRDWLLPLLMNGQVRVRASLDVTPAKGKLGVKYGTAVPQHQGWVNISLRLLRFELVQSLNQFLVNACFNTSDVLIVASEKPWFQEEL